MIIVDALGTSTPTSTTVVATSTSISPRAKACMTASFCSASCRGLDPHRVERGMGGEHLHLDDAPAGACSLRDGRVGSAPPGPSPASASIAAHTTNT
jgi:hypothetical protein